MRIINENIIKKNINNIKNNNEVIIVLKDNAYGIGINRMINILKELNIYDVAVLDIKEARLIRILYNECNILLLGKTNTKYINEIIKYNLIPTISDYSDYVFFKEHNIKCHLEIDIGMNRFGIKNNYLAIINDKIIDQIYIHIYDEKELNKINMIKCLSDKYNKKYHVGGSIVLGYTDSKVRIGKAIYKNCLGLYGEIINIKYIYEGESVGYEKEFYAKEDLIIGVCNIGYKNGLDLHYNGNVYIEGKYYKVVGKTCMDQCFIVIDKYIKIGNVVEFMGNNINEDYFLKHNKMSIYDALLFLN